MALKGLEGKTNKTPDYQQHLQTKPVTAEVSSAKTIKGAPVAESQGETQVLNPGVFTNGMSITVEGGRTLNLGNYESARIGVSITVPCEKISLDEAYKFATEWVSSKIEEEVKLAKG